MKLVSEYSDPAVEQSLRSGQLVVLRTDTIYGVVACASNRQAVERVYTLKGRQLDKPCIVLVADVQDIPGISSELRAEYLKRSQASPTSLIVPAIGQPDWITRGGDSVAYRVPTVKALVDLINQVGPLVAPSANPEGQQPASDVKAAYAYFAEQVEVYVDGGPVATDTPASRLLRFNTENHSYDRLR